MVFSAGTSVPAFFLVDSSITWRTVIFWNIWSTILFYCFIFIMFWRWRCRCSQWRFDSCV